MFNIKEAILDGEREQIKEFLKKFDLKYEDDINYSLYIEDNNQIIATVSLSDYIIKCLAIDDKYQGENLANLLLNKLIEKLRVEQKYYYAVFTKRLYENLFLSLGFKLIVHTEIVSALEFGSPTISVVLERMRAQAEGMLDCNLEENDIACVVAKADPFTNGHLQLIEYAANHHDYVLVFILQDGDTFFNKMERLSLAYVSLLPYDNVVVLPGSKYIISSFTFPGYFLHDKKYEEWAKIDVLIFKEYFMEKLHISKRYVGSETDDYMVMYNNILKDVLKDKLEEIPRYVYKDEVISAKSVRKLLNEGNVEEALRYVPRGGAAIINQKMNYLNSRK